MLSRCISTVWVVGFSGVSGLNLECDLYWYHLGSREKNETRLTLFILFEKHKKCVWENSGEKKDVSNHRKYNKIWGSGEPGILYTGMPVCSHNRDYVNGQHYLFIMIV